jgi:hypothetical protein
MGLEFVWRIFEAEDGAVLGYETMGDVGGSNTGCSLGRRAEGGAAYKSGGAI